MSIVGKEKGGKVRVDADNESVLARHDQMNASIGTFDFSSLISKIKDGDTWKIRDRGAITLTRSHGLHITLIAMHAGTSKPWHRVECPISIQIIEGRIEFITDAETVALKKGEILILQEGVRHHMKSIEEAVILLTLASTL